MGAEALNRATGARATVGPSIDGDEITFYLADPDRRFERVNLVQDLFRPRIGPEMAFDPTSRAWSTTVRCPPVDRVEYAFEGITTEGSEWMCDPANPLRTDGPFGPKSVVELRSYRPPEWLDAPKDEGRLDELTLKTTVLRTEIHASLWRSSGLDDGEPAPLLIVHDGPEFARYSMLLEAVGAGVATGLIPQLRVALLPPIDRDQHYSASAAYARAVAEDILPALDDAAPTRARRHRVGMGASLGALSMLHLHRRHPHSVGGLFLQSGSFFRQRYDRQEAGFVRFRRISRFVGSVLSSDVWPYPIPVAMTCGAAEENLANNQAVASALRRQGYEVEFTTVRDVHNWVAWRDALDPDLFRLLARLWS